MTARAVSDHKVARRKLLARAHIARKDLGLDDESYRDVIERLYAPHRSAAKLTEHQLLGLVQEFKRLGWADKPKRQRSISKRGDVRLIYVYWRVLRDGDAVRTKRPDAWIARQTRTEIKPDGVQNPEFLTTEEAREIIEQLKKWIRRVGLGDQLTHPKLSLIHI